MTAPALLRPLDEVEYEAAELAHWLDEDTRWRERSYAVGGPLRRANGTMAPVPAFMRLDAFTDRNGPVPEFAPHLGPCWLWTGSTVHGYGYVRIGERKVQAYRVNYERWIGPIPDGAHLDHLCRVRACVRPDHCEPCTPKQNIARSPIHSAVVKASRDRCPEGHLFDEENTYVRTDAAGRRWRRCRKCQAAHKRQATGASHPRKRATATHCANDHPWEGNLTFRPDGRRQCATCNREAGRRFRVA